MDARGWWIVIPKNNRDWRIAGKKEKLGTNAMKRVAAGAHLPTPWLFEPAKRPDDRADYWDSENKGLRIARLKDSRMW